MPPAALKAMAGRDPRVYQIAVLGALLTYGVLVLDFGVSSAQAAVLLGTALTTQWLCTRIVGLPRFDPRSALITGLSLCLLLRVDAWPLAAVAAAVAVGSKFVLRVDGKHVFNPANFGLVALLLVSDRVWLSPGQWGAAAFFGFFLACAGLWVVYRAARSDVTLAFLAAYAGLLFGRALWLGDPLTIPAHQLQNGALLIFAFFMISDPKTTPDVRTARLLFGALVAGVGGFVQFGMHEPNGPIWALAACAPLVPVLDRLFGGRRYRWPGQRDEVHHAKAITGERSGAAAVAAVGGGGRVLRFLRRQGGYRALQ